MEELYQKKSRKDTSDMIRNRCQIIIDLDEAHGRKITREESAALNGVCIATITNTIKKYADGGIAAVMEFKRNPNSGNFKQKAVAGTNGCMVEIASAPVMEGHVRWKISLQEDGAKVVLEIPVDQTAVQEIQQEPLSYKDGYWCLPLEQDPEFIACMEDILDVYKRPYNKNIPVVCMNEKPYQLLGETLQVIDYDRNNHTDESYIRNGTVRLFAFSEPLKGTVHIRICNHCSTVSWAEEIRYMVDNLYPDAEKIALVMDQQNSSKVTSLYQRYSPNEVRRIINKLELHYVPKRGSWLNIAEIELNVLLRQCMEQHIECIEKLRGRISLWESEVNALVEKVNWHFRTCDARKRLASLYPQIR